MIEGLVLAAGRSQRMGSPKLTLPWRTGGSVLGAVVSALQEGGVDRVVVVVGADREAVEAALEGKPVHIVENPNSSGGMLASIQIGLRAMAEGTQAALVTPGDLPAIRPATVRALVAAGSASPERLCVPVHNGRRGHPVLLPRRSWPDLLTLEQGDSLRAYLRRHPDAVAAVEVDDAGIYEDIDTPEDYRTAG